MILFAPTEEKIEKWIQEGNAKKLIKAFKSDDPIIKRLAAGGLGRIGGEQVLAWCSENARSQDKNTRWYITQILATIGSKKAMAIMRTVEDPVGIVGKNLPKKRIQ